MKHCLRRLLTGILLFLFAPGLLSGALAMSGDVATQSANNRMQPGALVRVDLTGKPLEYDFTPSANGLYDVYLFPEEDSLAAKVEVLLDGEVIASGEGNMRVLSCRLNDGTDYVIRLTGQGAAYLEVARETLSRCFDMPLELTDGEGYSKLIARAGDVHWYAFTTSWSGAAILSGTPQELGLRLRIWLFDAQGRLLATSDTLASGASVLSAQLQSGASYRVRVAAIGESTGKYLLSNQRSAVTARPESVRLSTENLTLQGREKTTLRAETLPAGVCPLVYMSSSDPSVAMALPDGTIAGRQPGSVVITAYAYGGASATCRVVVEEVKVEGVELSYDTLTMTVGEEASLSVQLIPENASDTALTFVTEDERVVTVDERGKVSAVGEGSAKVVAITGDGGFTDVVFVTVEPAPRRYRALLIGEQNYASTVEQLRPGSIQSVESIAKLLETASFGGNSYEVTTLMDAPRDSVIEGIRSAFADAGEGDLSLVYITCHGFYKAGMTFFVMADGSVLSAAELERELRGVPGEIVLMVDCCGSGGLLGEAGTTDDILEGVTSVFQGAVGGASVRGSRYRVIASALLDQDSYRISFSEDGEAGMATVFARAFCDAAGWSIDRDAQSAMNADADYNGEITLNELDVYMSRRVRWYLNLAGDYAQNVRVYPEGSDFVLFARTDGQD